jgi:hypothetical protein
MKYKLNEEVKKQIRVQGYPNNIELEASLDLETWQGDGFDMGHLVEVKERIEVDGYAIIHPDINDTHGGCFILCKTDFSEWKMDEIQKVNSALSGEVLTMEQIREAYDEWYRAIQIPVDREDFINFLKSKFQ